MSTRFRLLVFDWDGTLMDSQNRIVASFQSTIADLGVEPRTYAQISQMIGLGLDEGIAGLFPNFSPEFRLQFAERYTHYFLYANPLPTPLFPGVGATLRQLHADNYQLGVATGKSRIGLQRAITNSGLEGLFQSTRCAEETRSKPHPQMLLEIMQELDVSPAKTLVIGDSEYDLQMANNAGVASVAVSYGVHDKARLLACQPLLYVDDLSILPNWLKQ